MISHSMPIEFDVVVTAQHGCERPRYPKYAPIVLPDEVNSTSCSNTSEAVKCYIWAIFIKAQVKKSNDKYFIVLYNVVP